MANALLSTMHMLGMDDVEKFGNSTGPLSLSIESAARAGGA
jgi:hypothetical protein